MKDILKRLEFKQIPLNSGHVSLDKLRVFTRILEVLIE